MLAGCAPRAVVKITDQSNVKIPDISNIQSVIIMNDGPAQTYMYPTEPMKLAQQVLGMLQKAHQVSVQFPKLNQQWSTSGYLGPASLSLLLKNKDYISITPAFYIVIANGRMNVHYVTNVIKYKTREKTMYFKDSALFRWLKDDQWKPEFMGTTGELSNQA